MLRDRPQKRRHLAGNCGNDHGTLLAGGGEPTVTGTQTDLRFPGDRANRFGQTLEPRLQGLADAGRMAIAPSTLDQHSPGTFVASQCETAPPNPLAGRPLRWHQAEKGHQLAQQWLPWFKRIFDDGLDLPPGRPAELTVRLATGRYDALSGLTLNPRDDLDEILAHLEEVERDKLYSMRLRTLPSPDAARIEAVRDAGVQALPSIPELRVERHLVAVRERVFALWTDADAWTRWFLPPEGAEWIETPMVDARPGGRASIAVRQRGLDYCLSAIFTEIDAPARLTFRWTWGPNFPYGGPGDTDAVVEFQPDGSGTRVTLRQRGFTDPELRAVHERGWNRCFEGMARVLAETAG